MDTSLPQLSLVIFNVAAKYSFTLTIIMAAHVHAIGCTEDYLFFSGKVDVMMGLGRFLKMIFLVIRPVISYSVLLPLSFSTVCSVSMSIVSCVVLSLLAITASGLSS